MSCPVPTGAGQLVGTTLAFADCQARDIAALGWGRLATEGSPAALLTGALLTIFVALAGYRLMVGERFGLRDAVVAVAKVGLVLALTTSWPTWRVLANDVVLDAPLELAGLVGGAAGLPGSGGDLGERLQLVDAGLVQLGELGVGDRDTGAQVARIRSVNGRSEAVIEPGRQPVGIAEPIALALARLVFLLGPIAGLLALRLVAGILLALGPVVVAFLLFDATRGLAVGWVRALLATMVATAAVIVLLGCELAMVEPWLAALVTERLGEASVSGAPVELLALLLAFALAILAAIGAAARLAGGLRLPDGLRPAWPAPDAREPARAGARRGTAAAAAPGVPVLERSRATAVADALGAAQRREAIRATPVVAAAGAGASALARTAARTGPGAAARDAIDTARLPLGAAAALGRRAGARASLSAQRRDVGR
jgi:type IV secretion system protein VirB6